MLSNTVNGLWIRGKLSALEMLCIYSFLDHGYHFVLWVYDPPSLYKLPAGAEVKDARQILPEENVFSYKHSNQFGHGKGSYAGFSDVFRYKLLYEEGGWWTDMDVSCLKRFDFPGQYVFRVSKEDQKDVVGNIMHVPARSELMKICYDEAEITINGDNRDWMAPIRILNEAILQLGLSSYIYSFTNPDSWPVVSRLLIPGHVPDDRWFAIHWMNEEFRRLEIPKNQYLKGSYLGRKMEEFRLGHLINKRWYYWPYRIKVSRLYYSFLHVNRQVLWDIIIGEKSLKKSLRQLGRYVYYFFSDLYFVYTKPHFDIGKMYRKVKNGILGR